MKYGFVYIWFDRKYKRYYIGSHWGSEDDGYVCSSRWMRKSYSRRPNDFKRRILTRIYTCKKDMFELEYYFLSMIKKSEIKIRYYNLNIDWKHWAADPDKELSVKDKISKKLSGRKQHPDVARKRNETCLKNNIKMGRKSKYSEEEKISRSKTRKPIWNKGLTKAIDNRIIGGNKGLTKSDNERLQRPNNKKRADSEVCCPYCNKVGKTIIMHRWHFDKCKLNVKGDI